jgi:hypothetical protein
LAEHDPDKARPDLIRGGNQLSEKIMLQCNIFHATAALAARLGAL